MKVPVHAVVVPPDAHDLRPRFAADPGSWLPDPAEPVGEHWRVRLSAAAPSPSVPVVVAVGPVAAVGGHGLLVRALDWSAEARPGWFPALRADLELHPAEVRLVGTYVPPWTGVGAAADRVVGRHLAREVVRGFLASVVRRLARPGPCAAPPTIGHPVVPP